MLYTIERFLINLAKRMLGLARIEPAFIKAALRKPPPVHGGPRARRWPWPRRRHFDRREKQAVIRIMNREILSGDAIVYAGVEEEAYCKAFAKYMGGGYADAVNSGTNAIYVALKALDLEPGSEVIVPPATDPGGTMPVAMNLCVPIAADSAPGSLLTSAEQLKAVMTDRTSAIVVAHISGHSVDMDPILELAAMRGIPVVEDCSQAHGALYKGRMVGTLGRISAFSTMFLKHHCTGSQGGVVFTLDPFLSVKAKRIADRGKPIGAQGNPGNLIASLNFNQDEISMAIGRVQLEKLPSSVRSRRVFAALVEAGLQGADSVTLIGDQPDCQGSYLFLMLLLDRSKLCCDSQAFASALAEEGIDDVGAGYPVFPTDQPWHSEGMVFGASGLPWSMRQSKPRRFELANVRQAHQAIVRIHIHESLGVGEARDLVKAVKKIARYYRASTLPNAVEDESHAVTCSGQELSSLQSSPR
jgi:perosamine synthetase